MELHNPPYVHKDLRIEFLRILAMLLIVACHGIIHLNLYQQNTSGIDFTHLSLSFSNVVKLSVIQFGQVGVVIFFMITGYFLYARAFSWRRIGNVYVQMWLYSVLIFTGFAVLHHVVSSRILDRLFGKDQILTTVLGTFLPFSYRSY